MPVSSRLVLVKALSLFGIDVVCSAATKIWSTISSIAFCILPKCGDAETVRKLGWILRTQTVLHERYAMTTVVGLVSLLSCAFSLRPELCAWREVLLSKGSCSWAMLG